MDQKKSKFYPSGRITHKYTIYKKLILVIMKKLAMCIGTIALKSNFKNKRNQIK